MEKTKTSAAKLRANDKYNKTNYDRLNVYFLKGKKDIYKEVAAAAGYKNIGPFIEDLMDTVAASKGYGDRLNKINGGTINRQRKKINLHESTPEAAGVFSGIIK